MRLLDFNAHFPDEASCKKHFKHYRDKEGIVCSNCKGLAHNWLSKKWMYECKNCRFRTSLKKGTIMENSKLKFRTWYQILLFISATKKGFSASEVQRQIGKKRYEPVWNAFHKIRQAMGQRDDRYLLNDMVEFDDAFFEVATKESPQTKRGRGSQRQSKVAVSAESTILEDLETGKIERSCRYFKMKIAEGFQAEKTDEIITAMINQNSVVTTDCSTSYVNISNIVEIHQTHRSSKEITNTSLKWTHVAISNAKRNFLGVYHKIKAKYLQNYLNEFVYKLNRRYFKERLFDRVIIAMASSKWAI